MCQNAESAQETEKTVSNGGNTGTVLDERTSEANVFPVFGG